MEDENMQTWTGTRRHGHGDMDTWTHGDMETWAYEDMDMETWN
jgi:hypothetical protein